MLSVGKLSVKRNRIICISLILLLVLATVTTVFIMTKKTDKASKYVFGEQALKINGKIVETSVFLDEKNIFFERNKGNSALMQKTDEDVNDLILEEVIKKVLADDYFYNDSGYKATQKEVDDYYNKYVKPSLEGAGGEGSSISQGLDYKSEAEYKKDVELYILKLKSVPAIAKEYGISLDENEFNTKYAEYTKQYKDKPKSIHPKDEYKEMMLVREFSVSDKLNTWLDKLRSKAKIEILEPSLKAYRLYKNGEYSKAADEYKKAYKKYNLSIYKDKEKECRSKD
ncbi:hypothetical protein Cpap_1718 [Ruminiclostridium papyrosolvens DSM 2782]|uniref:Uncharacterized protein n=1 Tax=Ruminiclostridium papyrosolvens DSM 2782 TaxID=588581 RepID=F1TD89_9FIRM|nr:hypothetical protein [Ruminiclostridium papyrosolvens]EGD47527.1 hypothetical protein Cpap_1718 [Ruminiclostridium papyrosolvens DSM 2782]WES36526.1 hypothetical protein P0092_11325 [Ruminiclostridium papyrosolvens DSM 2782]